MGQSSKVQLLVRGQNAPSDQPSCKLGASRVQGPRRRTAYVSIAGDREPSRNEELGGNPVQELSSFVAASAADLGQLFPETPPQRSGINLT